MADLLGRLPIVGREIQNLRGLVEAQNAFMAELEEEVKDWQALSNQAEEKDVNWTDYKENHEDCWEAYVENPLAANYVDRLIDFVIKDGFQVVIKEDKDGKLQDRLDEHLEDSGWEEFQVQVCRESAIYGELFDRFFPLPMGANESVLLDPSTIKSIETDPDNVKKAIRYFREYQTNKYDENGNILNGTIVNDSIDADEIIHFKLNTVSNARRGISDLLRNLKWLERHKQVATNLVRRTNIQMSVIGEKIIKGQGATTTTTGGWKKSSDDATNSETNKRKERQVKAGTWYVHTPNLEYKFTPLPNDVKGMIDLLIALTQIIACGFGLSEHFMGITSASNLASADAVTLPILARMKRRQKEIGWFLKKHLKKAFEESEFESIDFELVPPEISEEDAVNFANSFKTLIEGLVAARDANWISDESAASTMGDHLDHFDSFDTEQEKIENQRRIEEEKNQQEPPPQIPAPDQAPMNPEDLIALSAAFREVDDKLSKVAMDDLITTYAKGFAEKFNKAKSKILPELERVASERGQQNTVEAQEMNTVNWKQEYKQGNPHWTEDATPSPLAEEFAKTMIREGFSKGRILEVGIGNGRDSIYLAKQGFEVIGIDIVKEAVQLAIDNAKKEKATVTFRVANIEKSSFLNRQFDGVYSMSVLHSTHLQQSLSEIYRILDEGGLLTAFFYTHIRTAGSPISYYTGGEIKKIASDVGFELLKFREGEKEDHAEEEGNRTFYAVATFKKPKV